MATISTSILICLLVVLLLEMVLRFYLLRYSPFLVRLAYALFLLSPKRVEERIIINQRIERGGFKSEKELFEHYATVSGKPYHEIEKKFGCEKSWLSFFSRRYYSGGHMLVDLVQKMHLGLVPKPKQRLQTLEINDNGCRNTGFDLDQGELLENQKLYLLLGDSVAFGGGATCDENTIAGRIGYYLNKHTKDNQRFFIVNHALQGANSFQELICLLQFGLKPDYIISFGGWNEADQAFFSDSKVPTRSRICDRLANSTVIKKLKENLVGRLVICRFIMRFISALIMFDNVQQKSKLSIEPDSAYKRRST